MNWPRSLPAAKAMSKDEYRERARSLRQALLSAQAELHEAGTHAVLLVAGVDGGGKGETVQLFNEWMDPRWIRTHAFDEPTPEETERPDFWRYWRVLPPRGRIAIFLSAWYSSVLLQRVNGGSDQALASALERIRRFEGMLADDGMLIFKLWLHLDASAQQKRFRELEVDPLQRWRVTAQDWENWSRYDEFAAAAEEILGATNDDPCCWNVIEGSDDRRRAVEAGDALLTALRAHIVSQGGTHRPVEAIAVQTSPASRPGSADAEPLEKTAYREELLRLQGRLNELQRQARDAGLSWIGVFEGRDAAGKGGAIRRAVAALDVRRVDVVRTGPPSDEESMHHYLWRFWRRIPRAGYATLFDRSWYGRVLVERVEELTAETDWRRAFGEINDFERQLVDDGAVLVKYWLTIDRAEQKRRFEERKRVPHKRWKLTDDDRRNRRLWKQYDTAISEMLERTTTEQAPWTVVEANDKREARLAVLRTMVAAVEARLEVAEARRA
jgi:polyphosphate:AMP phosphotransferase